MRTLAIIHTGGLGDFLQTFPVLEAARRRWPGVRITIIGRGEWMPLAAAAGLAEATLSADCCGLHRLFVESAEAACVPAALGEAEAIVSFLPHPALGRNLAKLTRARVVEARSFPSPGECAVPAAQFVYDQVAPELGLPAAEAVPRVRCDGDSAAAREVARRWPGLGESVAIAPGSGSRAKNWPLNRFVALSERLAAAGRPTVWLLGPAELEREEFARLLGKATQPRAAVPLPRDRALAGEPIVTVAAALSAVWCCVSNDSGVAQLSAALGRPTTILLGPSDAGVWGPRGNHVRQVVSTTGEMVSISLEEVAAAIGTMCWPRWI